MSLLGHPVPVDLRDHQGRARTVDQGARRRMGTAQYPGQLHRAGFIVTDLNRAMWQEPKMKEWLRGNQAEPAPGLARRRRAAGRFSRADPAPTTSPARSFRSMAGLRPPRCGPSSRNRVKHRLVRARRAKCGAARHSVLLPDGSRSPRDRSGQVLEVRHETGAWNSAAGRVPAGSEGRAAPGAGRKAARIQLPGTRSEVKRTRSEI